MFTKTTRRVKVTALPIYLGEQSDPEEEHYVWAYTIAIENHSDRAIQLINRSWRITDANGQVQRVQGAGVVGEQPTLNPGHAFQYTSAAVLSTPSGLMSGAYEMRDLQTQERFSVAIPAFSLDSPEQIIRPN